MNRGLKCFFLVLLPVLFYCPAKSQSKELGVVLRQIGHRMLLSGGDTTARVLPVKLKNDDTYIISFDKQIVIESDSLYNIVKTELGRIGILDFVTELKRCGTEDVYFSFLYSLSRDSITPCGGRTVPNGCYTLEITLLNSSNKYWFWLALPALMAFMIYILKKRRSPAITESVSDTMSVGNYRFDVSNRMLVYGSQTETLTDKETRLLSILLDGKNEIQNREYLMNELWAESGIMVVSKNLDVLVSRLRKKLSLDKNIKISSVHGVGYKLEVSNDQNGVS